jgi:hypothetical protein
MRTGARIQSAYVRKQVEYSPDTRYSPGGTGRFVASKKLGI